MNDKQILVRDCKEHCFMDLHGMSTDTSAASTGSWQQLSHDVAFLGAKHIIGCRGKLFCSRWTCFWCSSIVAQFEFTTSLPWKCGHVCHRYDGCLVQSHSYTIWVLVVCKTVQAQLGWVRPRFLNQIWFPGFPFKRLKHLCIMYLRLTSWHRKEQNSILMW